MFYDNCMFIRGVSKMKSFEYQKLKHFEHMGCKDFPCIDINKNGYIVPAVDICLEKIKAVIISEAPPENREDYFYANEESFYLRTTLQAFNDAGISVSSLQDVLNLGFYLTTAVKCAKTQYGVSAATIKNCSHILEKELALFPDLKVYLLMGDVAIKAFNYISKRQNGKNTIPIGSTYKIRKSEFYYEGKRVFPSYLQTGQNYLIEKSKRMMIAEDLAEAMKIIK
jgi:uracil-DNA glycosylase